MQHDNSRLGLPKMENNFTDRPALMQLQFQSYIIDMVKVSETLVSELLSESCIASKCTHDICVCLILIG